MVPERRHSRIPGLVDPNILPTGFRPTQISDLRLWFRADSLNLNNDDPVSLWLDESGNDNNLSSAGTFRPVYKTGIINGNPIVRFDLTDDIMSLESEIEFLDGFSFSLVFRRTSNEEHAIFIKDGEHYTLLQYGDSWLVGNTSISSDMAVNTFYLRTAIGNPLWIYRYSNGVQLTTTSALSFWGFLGIGGGGFIPKGLDIAEVVLFEKPLNSTERTNLESYLAEKYAIDI